jgi:hypothetical protein
MEYISPRPHPQRLVLGEPGSMATTGLGSLEEGGIGES